MLVATASVGLIAPIAAHASDTFNFEGINDYSRSKKSSSKKYFDNKSFVNEVNEDLAKLKDTEPRLEATQNNFEAGSFSNTTTMDGKVIFTIGALNDEDKDAFTEATMATYMVQSNLNTSFTGDDNLYIRLKSGNATDWLKAYSYGTYLSSSKGNSDDLKVDKIWYTFPVGDHTFWVGPKIENYYMHGTTPSLYKPVTKQFTLGGNGAAYGASTSPGAGFQYNADNGFAFSTNFTSKAGNTASGMLTDEAQTSFATQVGYTKPNYSVSAIVNMKYNGWSDSSYFTSDEGMARPGDGNSTNIGLRAWWRPDNTGTATPSISVGYDTSETDAVGNDNTNAYFVGLNWQDIISPDDRIGIAYGQPQKHEDDNIDPKLVEVYYEYKVNDSITLTPTIFGSYHETGGTAVETFGTVLNTTFKF